MQWFDWMLPGILEGTLKGILEWILVRILGRFRWLAGVVIELLEEIYVFEIELLSVLSWTNHSR